MFDETQRLSEDECIALFRSLFPGGLRDPALVLELAPEGWERSPWVKIAHPDPETALEEQLRLKRNLDRLTRSSKSDPDPEPEPTLDDILADWKEQPIEPEEECGRLLGYALWDIFSDNHEVIYRDGRIVDIGSFRGAAGFISDFLEFTYRSHIATPDERIEGALRSDYMDFYMGSAFIGHRADLTAIYEYIFRLLKRRRCDWRYSFPRIYLLRFDQQEKEDPADQPYSPSESFAKEAERREAEERDQEMQRQLDESASQTREELLANPPKTVLAYREVYHKDPLRWPEG